MTLTEIDNISSDRLARLLNQKEDHRISEQVFATKLIALNAWIERQESKIQSAP